MADQLSQGADVFVISDDESTPQPRSEAAGHSENNTGSLIGKSMVIFISDDDAAAADNDDKGSRQNSRFLAPDKAEVFGIPGEHWQEGWRKFELNLSRHRSYRPEWLVRPQHRARRGAPKSGYEQTLAGCWLDDYDPLLIPPGAKRHCNIDALPRWFGPLTYTVIYFNHERLPRNSLEFFLLCFQPVKDGDMEVWRKYRAIEEEIWVNKLDQHEGFKRIVADIHSVAFGQKEDSATRLHQMERAFRQFQEDADITPYKERDYFLYACSDFPNYIPGGDV